MEKHPDGETPTPETPGEDTTIFDPSLVEGDDVNAPKGEGWVAGKQKVRPQIELFEEVEPMVSRTLAALAENPRIGLYQRGHKLVRIVYDNIRSVPGMSRDDIPKYRIIDAPSIISVDVDYLREAVDRSAEFVRISHFAKGDRIRKILPPHWVLAGVIARGNWPFPRLEGIVEAPTLRPDGTVLERKGFDQQTGLLFDPGRYNFEAVNCNMSRQEAASALQQLDDIFVDFPFREFHHRSAAVAAALSVLVRPAIAGCVPLFAVRATVQGSGKTLLVNAIECLRSGRHNAPIDPYTPDPEEQRKKITAFAIDGTALILIDNIQGIFGSTSLDAVLTSNQWQDRLLGKNENVSFPMRAVWFITGNNVTFRGDLGRRVMPIDLKPNEERPAETRTSFTYGQGQEFLRWIQESRCSIVPACIGAVRAYLTSPERRKRKDPRLGSFESWDDVAIGTVMWAGMPDPRLGRIDLVENDDLERAALSAMLQIIYNIKRDAPWTSAELLNLCIIEDDLRTAVAEFAPSKKPGVDLPTVANVGYALRGVKGRIVDGLELKSEHTRIGSRFAVIKH